MVVDLGFDLALALSYAWDTAENSESLMKLLPRRPVTDGSIARYRKEKELGRSLTFYEKWKKPIEEETLVDSGTLSWAYLEIGTIETLGCFLCYFYAVWLKCGATVSDLTSLGGSWSTADSILASGRLLTADEQVVCLAHGQSAYYIALFVQQLVNLFVLKVKFGFPWGKYLVSNVKNFYGMLFGLSVLILVVFVPPFNIAFGTDYTVTLVTFPLALGSGLVLYLYAIIRVLVLRAKNPLKYSPEIAGLDLHPTRYSTK